MKVSEKEMYRKLPMFPQDEFSEILPSFRKVGIDQENIDGVAIGFMFFTK